MHADGSITWAEHAHAADGQNNDYDPHPGRDTFTGDTESQGSGGERGIIEHPWANSEADIAARVLQNLQSDREDTSGRDVLGMAWQIQSILS